MMKRWSFGRSVFATALSLGMWMGAVVSAQAQWCGNSYIYVGASTSSATWYTAGNAYEQPGGFFDGADLGANLSTLPLGGELEVWAEGNSATAELGYLISGPESVTTAQFIAMANTGAEGNNHKMQVTAPVDVIAAHELPAGEYTISIWFHSSVSGGPAAGDAWDSNGSLNYTARFSVAETTAPRINVSGETSVSMPESGPAVFNVQLSAANATAAAWGGELKNAAGATVTNWSALGATGTFIWQTAMAGSWSLAVTAYSDAAGTLALATRTVALSALEDLSNLGTLWHCPTNKEPWTDVTMCLPLSPSAGNTIWVRTGNYQPNGDMAAGRVWYRFGEDGAWASTNLSYETSTGEQTEMEDGRNVFWMAGIPSDGSAAGQFLYYYFEVEYTGESPQTTYMGMQAGDPNMYALHKTQAAAEAMPFQRRFAAEAGTEPGFIWHGGNLTRVSDTAVQVWVKIGYINGTNRWADEVKLEYTVADERSVAGRRSGVKALRRSAQAAVRALVSPTVVQMRYSHSEPDPGGQGDAMWWTATIENAALTAETAVLTYEIYARKTTEAGGTGNWLQAEYTDGSTAGDTFEYRMFSEGSGALQINGVNADYTTSKYFINEADENDFVTFHITYAAPNDAEAVELFTNLGRRDYADVDADGDGWPDGLVPPDGNWITASNSADAYWQAIPMAKGAGAYEKTLQIDKCGAYRITARYRARGQSTWTWYSDGPNGIRLRDHAVVISPRKAMEQTMYELNVLTTKATTPYEEGRGTFDDLARNIQSGNKGTFNEFSVDYLNKLGANCLWFQPIHPSGDSRVEEDPEFQDRYYPGSPYATKNYYAVNKYMSKGMTEEASMAAFIQFVMACDKATVSGMTPDDRKLETINVMLDGVMNHTSWDAIYGAGLALATNGLGALAMQELQTAYGDIGALQPGDRIATTGKLGINWYSWNEDYGKPASVYNTARDNNIGVAPERVDFGKWDDVAELFYGDYSTMVRWDDRSPEGELGPETSRVYNEDDEYYYNGHSDRDPTPMRPATKLLWRYMASYPEFWIKQTGHGGINRPGETDSDGVLLDDYGIDGLRCDYAQGLPSQFWEYAINRTRSFKWNFLFMAESLDGGKVGYRSNRHFDILNENMVFRFTQDKVSTPEAFQAALEERRGAYGGGLILLNLTGHDEPMPFDDPWVTASRYAMVSAIDGIPMIFYGQEQSISRYYEDGEIDKWKGFHRFEKNFGKMIPHFKKWNQMYVWSDPAYSAGDARDSRAMAQFYGRVNHARLNSAALQGKSRWFLNDNERIMAVAKWEKSGENPNLQDAVFAAVLFVNEGENGATGAAQTYDISAFAGQMGIENREDRLYTVRNLAASNPNAFVWEAPQTGAAIYENGLFVGFAGVESGENAWSDGAVAQYLKIVDVTDYAAPVLDEVDVPTAYAGYEVAFAVSARGDGRPLVDVTGVTPTGTDHVYTNGVLSFTPARAGTYVFTFTAQNRLNNRSVTNAVQVVVLEDRPPEYEAPVFSAITVPTGKRVGEEVSFAVAASGNGNPVVSVLRVEPAATEYAFSAGRLVFTPAVAGEYAFTFLAQNAVGGLSATAQATVSVLPGLPTAVEISDITLPSFASGGQDFTLTAVCANLPPGLTSVEVWTATALVDGGWNWEHSHDAAVSGDVITVSLPARGIQMISVGKPAYLQ
ncbi:MAG: hypothetical protein LBN38_04170 [Verrucomicrobiota bacterium]|jgi:hypothetical protein|nr:hypothetical protein [Verrucomicrobiota bacterium]